MPYIIDDSLYLMLLMSHLCDFPMNRPTRVWQVTLWKWPNLSEIFSFQDKEAVGTEGHQCDLWKEGTDPVWRSVPGGFL